MRRTAWRYIPSRRVKDQKNLMDDCNVGDTNEISEHEENNEANLQRHHYLLIPTLI